MSNSLLYAIYIIIAVLGILATILGIINWFLYSSNSTAINHLNDEIEKKGREFDTLKGNIISTTTQQHDQSGHGSIIESQNIEPSMEPVPSTEQSTISTPEILPNVVSDESNLQDSGHQANETPQIDIVRNVRGQYEHPTTGVMKRETVIMKLGKDGQVEDFPANESTQPDEANETNQKIREQAQPNYAESQKQPEIEISDKTIIDNPPNNPDAFENFSLKRNTNQNRIDEFSVDEVMDVISEIDSPNKMNNDVKHGIEIPLFSKAQNDADFNAMWQEVQKVLNDAVIPIQIKIDFTNIFFLYKEEMEYLRKVHTNVKEKNCTLGFINCSPELVKVIWEDNELGNLILDI